MERWRYEILVELHDLPDSYISITEPRQNALSPWLHKMGLSEITTSWRVFDKLMEAGHLKEISRKTETEPPIKGMTFIHYQLSDTGRMALLALPKFRKHLNEQRKVTL